MAEKFLYKNLSHKILGMAFSIHNVLGPGLLESAYEGAFVIELRQAGISFEQQKVYPLYYKNELAGAYIADLVVDDAIILELKSVRNLNRIMEAQLLNYLKLSGLRVGYLLNFNGVLLQHKRLVL